jgi:hypothetical protein
MHVSQPAPNLLSQRDIKNFQPRKTNFNENLILKREFLYRVPPDPWRAGASCIFALCSTQPHSDCAVALSRHREFELPTKHLLELGRGFMPPRLPAKESEQGNWWRFSIWKPERIGDFGRFPLRPDNRRDIRHNHVRNLLISQYRQKMMMIMIAI